MSNLYEAFYTSEKKGTCQCYLCGSIVRVTAKELHTSWHDLISYEYRRRDNFIGEFIKMIQESKFIRRGGDDKQNRE